MHTFSIYPRSAHPPLFAEEEATFFPPLSLLASMFPLLFPSGRRAIFDPFLALISPPYFSIYHLSPPFFSFRIHGTMQFCSGPDLQVAATQKRPLSVRILAPLSPFPKLRGGHTYSRGSTLLDDYSVLTKALRISSLCL